MLHYVHDYFIFYYNFSESNYIKKNISQRRKFTSQISFISIINDTSNERHTGDQYLYWLGCGCAFLFFIKWWWTPYVMGLQLILFILKKLCKLFIYKFNLMKIF